MQEEQAHLYRRVKIALQTGWTFEYIDSLGVMDEENMIQVMEAEIAAQQAGRK